MGYQQKVTGKAMSMPAGLALGAFISMLLTVIGSGVLAKLTEMEVIDWERIGYGVMIMLLLSSFFGALTASGKIKHQKLPVCFAAGMIYFGLLLCITALFFGGQYEAVGVTAAVVLAGSLSAALLTSGKRGGNPGKIRRSHR